MLRKTITYQDLDGNPITEEFEFGLTKSELAEMEISTKGGMKAKLEAMIAAQDGAEVFKTLKEILKKAYGVRSADNKRFIKSDELWAEFEQTGAYDTLVMELLTDGEKSAAFMAAIVPNDLSEKVLEAQKTPDFDERYSREKLLAMSQDEFDEIAGTDPMKMPHAILQVAMQRKSQAQQA